VAIDAAIAQTDRMARLIAELLNQSRLSSNALSLSVVAFDLVDAVAEAITRHEYGETARIVFRRPAGAVALTLHGSEAHVRVADHGVGVSAGEQAMLFTPFYRTSRTSHVHGTGLGLHISQQLATRHRGGCGSRPARMPAACSCSRSRLGSETTLEVSHAALW
jgi:signal transduction histidine kinase